MKRYTLDTVMSDNEMTDGSTVQCVSTESSSDSGGVVSGEENYVFQGNFLPYQGEPIASSEDESSSKDESLSKDEEDIDGLTRAVLEESDERRIPVESC